MTEKGIEHNVACSRNLHCLFVIKWVPSIDTYLNWRWRNVPLAVMHFLACSYNLCNLLSVCNVIALFLAQARPLMIIICLVYLVRSGQKIIHGQQCHVMQLGDVPYNREFRFFAEPKGEASNRDTVTIQLPPL